MESTYWKNARTETMRLHGIMNVTNTFINLEARYSAKNYHPLDVVLCRGQGVYLYDVAGKKYLDFLSGYSALNQGHIHKTILKAAQKQIKELTLTSRAFRNDQFGLFCKEICQLTGFEMVLPMNSGSEAVETALKTARKWGYKRKKIQQDSAEIIVANNNFHGRTISIISFSTETQYRTGFGPFTPGFKVVPFGNAEAINKSITKNTVAVLLEPIQGEGGIIIPPTGYLSSVTKICKQNNILLMLDEIQTGLGRTGKLFSYQHETGVKPDVLIVGKALSGGFYPISAVLSSKEILGVFSPGDHGSTFGGNPLACAICRAAIKVIIKDKLVENSAQMGAYFMSKLNTINSRWIKEIRGRGLLIGIELTKDSGGARHFCEILLTKGILCKETHDYVLRLAPPLIITKRQVDDAFIKIKRVLETS